MRDKNYIPIDCNLYDRFTEAATLGITIRLGIITEKEVIEVEDQVADLYTENKIEYIVLVQNGKHRLDKVQLL